MAFFTIVDVIYIIYGLIVHAVRISCFQFVQFIAKKLFQLQWNPSVAILVTTDFFLNTLNVSIHSIYFCVFKFPQVAFPAVFAPLRDLSVSGV